MIKFAPLLLLTIGLVISAAPHLRLTKTDFGATVQVSGAAGEARLEASTNLVDWVSLGTANSASADFSDPAELPRRFYRAVQLESTNLAQLQFVAPSNHAIIVTNQPSLELAYSGVELSPSNIVIRHRGTNVPGVATLTSNRVRFDLSAPLPEGFALLHAAVIGPNAPSNLVAALSLNVRASTNNLSPEANPDLAAATGSTAVAINVLANDRDPNDDPLQVSGVTQPAHGTATLVSGIVTYTPAAGFTGVDYFEYTAEDGRGGTNRALVRVSIELAAGTTAYIVDAPAAPNEFRELAEALAFICASATAGAPGRIVIRTDRLVAIETLRITCPVRIEREDGRPAFFAGRNAHIISEANLTWSGLNLVAEQITFESHADLSISGATFGGHVLIRVLTPVQAQAQNLRAASAEGQKLELVGFEAPSVTAAFNSSADVQAEIGFGESGLLRTEGILKADSEVQIQAVKNNIMTAELRLEGRAKLDVRGAASANLFEQKIDAAGDASASFGSTISGKIGLDLGGLGKLSAEVSNSQAHEWSGRLHTREIDYRGRNNTTYQLDWTVGNDQAAVAATLNEDQLRVRAAATLLNTRLARLDLGVAGMVSGDKFTLTNRGTLLLHLHDDFILGGMLGLTLEDGDADLNFERGTLTKGLHAILGGGVVVDAFRVDHVQFQDDALFDFGPESHILIGGVNYADFELSSILVSKDRGGFLPRQSLPGGAAREARLNASAPREFVIDHCTFTSNGGPGTPAPISLYGLDSQVRIENNTIQASPFAVILSEIDAPAIVRNNVLIGGGIAVDGDIEGEGRPGMSAGPVEITGNIIEENNPSQGITLQDVKLATVTQNRIGAQTGFTLSAGYATLTSNIFNVSSNGSVAIQTLSGPGGPAALVAEHNTITGATPLRVLPESYTRFASNRFISALPRDGDEPISMINLGTGSGITSVDMDGNEFDNVTIAALGTTYFRLANSRGTFSEIGVIPTLGPAGLPSGAPLGAIIENNQLSGDFPRISVSDATHLIFRGNIIADLSLDVGGFAHPSYTEASDNTLPGNSSVNTSGRGFLRLTGNVFGADGYIDDPDGTLLNNPSANTINFENISSPIDFNGDADQCADYPAPEFIDDPEDPCGNGEGQPMRAAPSLPAPSAPPWPVF